MEGRLVGVEGGLSLLLVLVGVLEGDGERVV